MSYQGMCIGGPFDGRMLGGLAPVYEVQMPNFDILTPNYGRVPKESDRKIFTYVHVVGLWGKLEIDFWIDADGPMLTGSDAIAHMINFYSKTQKNLRSVSGLVALDQHPLTIEACAVLQDVKQRIFVKHGGSKNGRERLQFSTVENPKLHDGSLAVFFGDQEMDKVERFARRWIKEGMTGGAKVAMAWSK